MDSKVFGQFIAGIRKENNMTQADLAELIGVTDKAVSRWERGIGFPDINTLEPLANALGISVPELMRSEKSEMEKKKSGLSDNEVTEMMANAVEMAKENQRQDRVSVWIGGIVTVAVAALVKLSGRANVGGALAVGAVAALAAVGIYFFDKNQQDKAGRKIYGFFMLLGIAMSLMLLRMAGVDPVILAWGIYGIFAVVVIRSGK